MTLQILPFIIKAARFVSFFALKHPSCMLWANQIFLAVFYSVRSKRLLVFNELFRSFKKVIKGAQAWDIRERVFYTNQTCTSRWLGDWRKKMTFRKLECLFEGFHYEYLIKRMISMCLKTKKIQDSQKKSCVRCLRDPHLKFKKDF